MRNFVIIKSKPDANGRRLWAPFFIMPELPYDFIASRWLMRELGYTMKCVGSYTRNSGSSTQYMSGLDEYLAEHCAYPLNCDGKLRDPKTLIGGAM